MVAVEELFQTTCSSYFVLLIAAGLFVRTVHLALTIEPGYGGVRYELDGRPTAVEGPLLTVRHREHYAELPMAFIFMAWPVAGVTWVLFLGEAFVASFRVLLGKAGR